ncbi:hypothetical protein KI387_036212, partial [Taxus chinensis]
GMDAINDDEVNVGVLIATGSVASLVQEGCNKTRDCSDMEGRVAKISLAIVGKLVRVGFPIMTSLYRTVIERVDLLVKFLVELEKLQLLVLNASILSFSETTLDLTLSTQ